AQKHFRSKPAFSKSIGEAKMIESIRSLFQLCCGLASTIIGNFGSRETLSRELPPLIRRMRQTTPDLHQSHWGSSTTSTNRMVTTRYLWAPLCAFSLRGDQKSFARNTPLVTFAWLLIGILRHV